jgi:folate-binding protein YgfZ
LRRDQLLQVHRRDARKCRLGIPDYFGADREWLEARGLPADAAAGTCVTLGDLQWIYAGRSYWQVLGPAAALGALAASLPAAPTGAAELAEIGLGLPVITATLADRYIAQMLNFDALDALAFDKGCYPGQEVIARVHHLGDVKRRVRRYATDRKAPPVGTAVLNGQGTTVGEVVRSAATASAGEVLAVVEHTATGKPLTSDGAALAELPLPFTIPR